MKLILMAGPCVIESAEVLHRVCSELEWAKNDEQLEFYFKSSFDKANRTSISSFRGPGLARGLQMLADIKAKFNVKIITDIHESAQAAPAAEVADALQIPAFLCRQTDLLVAAARTNAAINIKKGQFLNPADMRYSIAKVAQTRGFDYDPAREEDFIHPAPACTYAQGGDFGVADIGARDFFSLSTADFSRANQLARAAKVYAVERGATFGYGNLVVDMRSLAIMRAAAPVIFDATHSVQLPGAAGGASGGAAQFVRPLARAAAAFGVDGFFFEVHFEPCKALCDGPNMLATKDFKSHVNQLKQILTKG